MKSYPFIVPLRFSSICPTPASRTARFHKDCPFPAPEQLRERYFQYVDREQFKKSVPVLFRGDYIALEQICVNFGFQAIADQLKSRRLNDMVTVLLKLGLVSNVNKTWQLKLKDLETL